MKYIFSMLTTTYSFTSISCHSSYVLVSVLYMAQSVLLENKEELTFPKYKGDFTQV